MRTADGAAATARPVTRVRFWAVVLALALMGLGAALGSLAVRVATDVPDREELQDTARELHPYPDALEPGAGGMGSFRLLYPESGWVEVGDGATGARTQAVTSATEAGWRVTGEDEHVTRLRRGALRADIWTTAIHVWPEPSADLPATLAGGAAGLVSGVWLGRRRRFGPPSVRMLAAVYAPVGLLVVIYRLWEATRTGWSDTAADVFFAGSWWALPLWLIALLATELTRRRARPPMLGGADR